MNNIRTSSELDNQIRHALICNPALSIDYCENILEKAEKYSVDGKEQLLKNLKSNIASYRKRVEENRALKLGYQELCEKASQRVQEWEERFGKITTEEMADIVESTSLGIADLFADRLNPMLLCNMVEKYVKGQHGYCQALSLCFYSTLLHKRNPLLSLPKSTLLAYGPSGTGKTFAVRVMADKLGLGLETINANGLVQEGIVGTSLSDVFTRAYVKSGGDLDYVSNLVIFIDEFDKLFTVQGTYNEQVTIELLNLLDNDNVITFNESFDKTCGKKQISSHNLTFILSGVFDPVIEIASKRINTGCVGFANYQQRMNGCIGYADVKKGDFSRFFRRDEIFGRITDFVMVEPHTKKSLKDILCHSAGSPMKRYTSFFDAHNISLSFTDEAIDAIVDQAFRSPAGVREFDSTLNKVLKPYMFNVQPFARDGKSRELTITMDDLGEAV